METTKIEATHQVKRTATLLAVLNMELSILAALLVLAPWLTAVMKSGPNMGLSFDYTGWGVATGFYTPLGYPLDTVTAFAYWLAIVSVIGCAVLSIASMISLYASSGKRKPTAFLVLVESLFAYGALIGLPEVCIHEISRLGYLVTATVVVGWGLIGEMLLTISLFVPIAALWSVLQRAGKAQKTEKEA